MGGSGGEDHVVRGGGAAFVLTRPAHSPVSHWLLSALIPVLVTGI